MPLCRAVLSKAVERRIRVRKADAEYGTPIKHMMTCICRHEYGPFRKCRQWMLMLFLKLHMQWHYIENIIISLDAGSPRLVAAGECRWP